MRTAFRGAAARRVATLLPLTIALAAPGVLRAQDGDERLALAARAYEDGLKDFARSQLEGFLASSPQGAARADAAYLLGRIHFEQRRWKQAADAYEIAAAGTGESAVQANYWLAEARRRAGAGDPAEAYEAFIARATGDPLEADARYRLGLLRYSQGKFVAAEKEFARCAAIRRCSPDARYWQGLAQVQQGEWRAAAATLDAAVPESKTLAAERAYWRGLALYRAGDDVGAAKALRDYLTSEATGYRADARALLADACERMGNWTEARAQYEAFVRDHPEDPRAPAARFALARAAMRAGDAAAARERFVAIAGDKDAKFAPQALAQLCWIDVEARRYAEARTHCAQALVRSGGPADTLKFLLAEASFYESDWKEAAARYAEVEGVKDLRDEALFKGGRALVALGRYPEAETKLAALAQEFPAVEPAHVACLRALAAQGKAETPGPKALDALATCAERAPAGAPYVESVLWTLGVHHLQGGEAAKARAYLERLVAEFPKGAEAPRAHLYLARIEAAEGRSAQARAAYAKAAAGANASVAAEASYALGEQALEGGRLDEAATRYEDALAKAADLPDVREAARLRLGMIAERQGRVDDAVVRYGIVARDAPQAEVRDLARKRLLLLQPPAPGAKGP